MAVIFTEVKVGDRVWISSGGLRNTNRKSRLETVRRVAPTMITLGQGDRYYRANGARVGGVYSSSYATCIATPDEIKEWENRQDIERQQRQTEDLKRQQAESKRQELNLLFGGQAYVSGGQNGEKLELHFYALTEEQVRNLAKKIKGPSPSL